MEEDFHMRTQPVSTYLNEGIGRKAAAIIIFAAITALTARITIPLPFTPVPITLQTFAVVLSGLVLGSRSGALAQLLYLGLIAVGLPFDASGLGAAAFFGPTAGYLVGFVPGAFVAGWLAERMADQKWTGNFVAAVVGMLVIYLVGASWLAVFLASWQKAWLGGVAPFIVLDLIKAALAAAVAESGRLLFRR
jgi:biotin transport system substrate-specific component